MTRIAKTKMRNLRAQALKKAPQYALELERMNHLFFFTKGRKPRPVVLGRFTTMGDRFGIRHVVETWNPTKRTLEFHNLKEMELVI